MISHVWSLLCSHTIIEQGTNSLTLYNVLEQVGFRTVAPPPQGALPLNFELVTMWIRSDPEVPCLGKQRVMVYDPAGDQKAVGELEINLDDAERCRTRVVFGGLKAGHSGCYIFRVDFKEENDEEWHEVARIPLTVTIEVTENPEEEAVKQPDKTD